MLSTVPCSARSAHSSLQSPNQALNIDLRDSRTIIYSFLLSCHIPLGARLSKTPQELTLLNNHAAWVETIGGNSLPFCTQNPVVTSTLLNCYGVNHSWPDLNLKHIFPDLLTAEWLHRLSCAVNTSVYCIFSLSVCLSYPIK
jgi:hypothetical protein